MVRAFQSDVEVLRVLINLLQNAQEPVVLAVAAHDLGQYVKHYDRGKKYVKRFALPTQSDELSFLKSGRRFGSQDESYGTYGS